MRSHKERIERATNPTVGDAIKYFKSMVFPSDMSTSTLFAVNVNKIAITAMEEKLEREETCKWERMINAYNELEGFMCKCGCTSNSASNYCPNCGCKMED